MKSGCRRSKNGTGYGDFDYENLGCDPATAPFGNPGWTGPGGRSGIGTHFSGDWATAPTAAAVPKPCGAAAGVWVWRPLPAPRYGWVPG
jgi:hypothetical protein